jgi:hypothetical protein
MSTDVPPTSSDVPRSIDIERITSSMLDCVSEYIRLMNSWILVRAAIAVSISQFMRKRRLSSSSRSIGSWMMTLSRPFSFSTGSTRYLRTRSRGSRSRFSFAIGLG